MVQVCVSDMDKVIPAFSTCNEMSSVAITSMSSLAVMAIFDYLHSCVTFGWSLDCLD